MAPALIAHEAEGDVFTRHDGRRYRMVWVRVPQLLPLASDVESNSVIAIDSTKSVDKYDTNDEFDAGFVDFGGEGG